MRLRLSALVAGLALIGCSSDPEPLETPDAGGIANDGGGVANDAGIEPPDAGLSPDAGPQICLLPSSTGPGVVQTAYATLRGEARGESYAYLGVRYAAPPIGALRFKDSVPPACEAEVRDAITFGAECPQLNRNDVYTGDEDCLFLNIWAPKNPPPQPRPVLFFIHGGGNNQGSSSISAGAVHVYDGQKFAERGNVVVTINYRLGALGFAAHPGLDSESATGTSGNYALSDQIAALKWVRDNISLFGGDPEKVMIFGESAGGLNVCALYASPPAQGLFSRAIMQSGGCVAAPKTRGVEVTNNLVSAAGCAGETDAIACLRNKTPRELIDALPPEVDGLTMAAFGLIVDGNYLTENVLTTLATRPSTVPLIVGSNKDETYLFLPPSIPTPAAFEQAARAFLLGAGAPPAKIPDILAIYPISDYNDDPHAALVALTTDWRWSCPGRAYVRTIRAAGSVVPLYRYYFTQTLDPMRAPMVSRAGAYHGLELFYVFGSIDGAGGYLPTMEDSALSETMMSYWSRFADTGDPNGGADPSWPLWSNTGDIFQDLKAPPVAGSGIRTAQCDALEALLR